MFSVKVQFKKASKGGSKSTYSLAILTWLRNVVECFSLYGGTFYTKRHAVQILSSVSPNKNLSSVSILFSKQSNAAPRWPSRTFAKPPDRKSWCYSNWVSLALIEHHRTTSWVTSTILLYPVNSYRCSWWPKKRDLMSFEDLQWDIFAPITERFFLFVMISQYIRPIKLTTETLFP